MSTTARTTATTARRKPAGTKPAGTKPAAAKPAAAKPAGSKQAPPAPAKPAGSKQAPPAPAKPAGSKQAGTKIAAGAAKPTVAKVAKPAPVAEPAPAAVAKPAPAPVARPEPEPAAVAKPEAPAKSATPAKAETAAAQQLPPAPEADEEELVGFGLREAADAMRAAGEWTLREERVLRQALPDLASDLARIGHGDSDIGPQRSDKRFTDPAWQSNRFLHRLMQAYLYLGSRLDDAVGGLGIEGQALGRARFAAGLLREALAPTNWLLTNPAAIRLAIETRGGSLRSGLHNLVEDVRYNHGMPSQVDLTPFKVGTNLAVSAGSVIYRSEVCELIQYTPLTPTVHARPLLVVPPQVNKYYALDLAPGRSMYEHLLKRGFQVFSISWRNPTAEQRDWNIDTYASEILDVIDVVRDVSGSPDVNLMGGCLGGMMVALVAAVLAARGDDRVHSATMGVTLLDFDTEAQILLFATPRVMAQSRRLSELTGVIEGWQMAEMFAWLRPNDLVWNYWVNNYLLGRKPPAFDILAWNADTTRLTAGFLHQILDIVEANELAHPGGLTVLGTPVELSAISCDTFVVAGRTDHITPWQGCYRTTQLVSGRPEFVLCSSGHIQTVVADPDHPRLGYYVNPQTPADAAAWMASAQRHEGSWWDHYAGWLADRSGEREPAPREAGNGTYPPAAAAPGSYVLA